MFLQILAMIRNNCYVVHLDHYGPKKDGHKLFTLSFIQALIDQAIALSVQESPRIPSTPRLHTAYPTTPSQVSSPPLNNQLTVSASASPKRPRLGRNSNLQLEFIDAYPHCFQEPHHVHMPSTIPIKVKGVCIYCSYLFRKNVKDGNMKSYNKSVKRATKICAYYTDLDKSKRTHFLCKDHFDCFHSTK